MRLVSVGLVPGSEGHLVVLREEGGRRLLAISVGLMEAAAIASAVEGVTPPRPMTHDLIVHLLNRLHGELTRVSIHDLRDEAFIGQLDIRTERGVIEVDCRPSDGIALAVRVGCPIFCAESVLEQAGLSADDDPADGGAG